MTHGQIDYNALFMRLKENEELDRKFFEIQTEVLSTLNFEDLFSKLLKLIKLKFGIPYVWLTLIEGSKPAQLMRQLRLSEPVSFVTREDFLLAVGSSGSPLLVNRGLERLGNLQPAGLYYDFRSLAVVPLSLDGEIIGSFNQADPSIQRFRPGIDTCYLEQLALVVSICLSNVVAHEELRAMAFKDPLTGLLNRRAMERVLKRELARAQRYASPLSVVFVDLDEFKQVNDRFGHDRGDELLCYAAERLLALTRESDIVARFAGDEFVLILPGVAAAEAEALMQRIKAYFLKYPLKKPDQSLAVKLSFGVAQATQDEDHNGLLKRADDELYRAKKAGKAAR
ncbi:MAG: Diguanylate cyclase DosC [Deltaproteobacteria bacterium ADurb.Bin510]|nr:MAG: Diguanylate cyclase DosC [Deltaproteobacteria bacterium ADurb.Bin510]